MIYFFIILARPVAWHFAQEVGPLRELGILVAFWPTVRFQAHQEKKS